VKITGALPPPTFPVLPDDTMVATPDPCLSLLPSATPTAAVDPIATTADDNLMSAIDEDDGAVLQLPVSDEELTPTVLSVDEDPVVADLAHDETEFGEFLLDAVEWL